MDEPEKRGLVILGGGPAGYTAAFYAADRGLEVTLVEPSPRLGGVCLHRGCIPSKALIHAVEVIRRARDAEAIGVLFETPHVDLDRLRAWKESVVDRLSGGLETLARQRKIDRIVGRGECLGGQILLVHLSDGTTRTFRYDTLLVATGSSPVLYPGLDDEEGTVWDSTRALELLEIPRRLLVVGGGYIGLELGSVYAGLGSEVTILEKMPGILPGLDRDLVQVFLKKGGRRFRDIWVGAEPVDFTQRDGEWEVAVQFSNGEMKQAVFDRILFALGRRPRSEGMGLERTKVRLDPLGYPLCGPDRKTDDPHIWIAGDLAGGLLLAHKASHEARAVIDILLGKRGSFSPAAIPAVVYTDPEIAVTGLTEIEAQRIGREVSVWRYPWAASGRALTLAAPEGLTKWIVEPGTNRLLGAGIVGPHAGELIAEATLAIEWGAKASDLAETIHPHPTLSETLMEAAELVEGTCPHLLRPTPRQPQASF